MKKILSAVMALLMLLSCSALAEVDYAEWGANLPIVPEGEAAVTLKISVPQSGENYDADKVWFWAWATKAMNLTFDVEQIPSDGFSERKNLMFASGDLPDILFGTTLTNAELVKYGQDEQQLLAINEYMTAELMPNLLAASEKYNLSLCYAPDGNMYAAPMISSSLLNISNGHPIYYNKEWADELGIAVPTTVEALTDLLRAYKAADPDCIPMGGSATSVNYVMVHLMNGVGLGVRSGDVYAVAPANDNEGNLVVPCTTEQYKDYLTVMNTWYTEGLISPDFFTMDRTTDMAQAAEGKYGAWAYPVDQVTQDFDTVRKFYALPTLRSAKNDTYVAPYPVYNKPGAAIISAYTENPEICAKFMDFFYSPLGCIYGWDGPMAGTEDTLGMVEGWWVDDTGVVHYGDVENGNFTSSYTYIIGMVAPCSGARINYAGDLREDISKYDRVSLQQRMAGKEPQIKTKNPELIDQFPLYTWYEHANGGAGFVDSFAPDYVYFDADTSTMVNDLKTVINSYAQTESAKFITGIRPLDEFDAFVSELKTMGLEEYLQYYKDVSGL